jgi:hypothetical protein
MQMTSRARPKTKMTRNPLSPLMDRKFLNWQRFRWHAQQLSTVFPCKPAGKNDPILYYIDMAHGIYIYEECISIMLYNQMVKKQPFYIPLHWFCYGLFI